MTTPRLGPVAGCVVAAALCAAAGPASAQKPDVLVLPYQALNKGISAELAEQTTVVITQEMGEVGVQAVRADDVAETAAPSRQKPGKSAPAGDPQAGERAQELIAEAKLKMEDSDLAPAIEALKKAIKLLNENGDAVPDLRLLPEAYLQLGVAYFRDGDEDQADEALTQAVHFSPTRELEENEYPPIFIRVFQRVRFNVLRRPRAAIEVRAAPGAQVLLDGRNLGKAPLQVTEALPGTHWLRVERPGESPQVKKIVLKSKRTILVEFEGGEAGAEPSTAVGVLGAIAKNSLDKAQIGQLRAAGKRAGTAYVMIGAIYKTDTAYNIYTSLISVDDGSYGRLVDIAFDLDMLSAQIEVFKLVEDAKKQIKADKLTNPIADPQLVLAPKIDLRAAKKKAVGAEKETKLDVVVAAPPPIQPPKDPSFAAEGGGGRAPVGAVASKGTEDGGAVVRPPPSVVPKDEEDEGGSAKPPPGAGATSMTTTVVPVDEDDGSSEGPKWWIWALVGVAVAGGAVAGGVLIASSGGTSEVPLRIQW